MNLEFMNIIDKLFRLVGGVTVSYLLIETIRVWFDTPIARVVGRRLYLVILYATYGVGALIVAITLLSIIRD